ncbi:conjugal transfer protein TraG, partial [Bradyrhizobium diazoefficiens]|nr:conjugal transfer protein TraG [Bradyrhizobium diazoefficiens]MBR0892597.1 conjugal transfer protein TraG [Bradyrhizobium diazoefficiens]MBR0924328.1 conjugal transfer protein TraG [Bradyrhizobium diazoefficiens]
MRANKIALAIVPAVLMASLCLVLTGIEAWLSKFGTTPNARLVLGRIGIALPYVIAAAIGVVFLFAAAGATAIRSAGWSVVFGGLLVVAIAASREIARLHSFANSLPAGDRL